MSDKLKVVSVIFVDKFFHFFNVMFSGLSSPKSLNIHENLNSLLYFETDNTDVNWLLIVLLLF